MRKNSREYNNVLNKTRANILCTEMYHEHSRQSDLQRMHVIETFYLCGHK